MLPRLEVEFGWWLTTLRCQVGDTNSWLSEADWKAGCDTYTEDGRVTLGDRRKKVNTDNLTLD